jgi:UPF0716 family protein affecting phage T7 exclusion
MFKQLLKFLTDNVGLLFLIAIFVVTYWNQLKEGFSNSIRYMYMYNPIPRNSSYDVRGDPFKIKKDNEKIGVFYNSSLEDNHRNLRLEEK